MSPRTRSFFPLEGRWSPGVTRALGVPAEAGHCWVRGGPAPVLSSVSAFQIIAARRRLSAGRRDGRVSCAAKCEAGQRSITPQATRAPEFPAGSVFSSSGSAWMISEVRGPALDGVATRLTREQLIRQVLQKSPPAAACSFDRDRYLTMPSAALGSLSISSASPCSRWRCSRVTAAKWASSRTRRGSRRWRGRSPSSSPASTHGSCWR